jgi:hypothetical protein
MLGNCSVPYFENMTNVTHCEVRHTTKRDKLQVLLMNKPRVLELNVTNPTMFFTALLK